MALASTRLRTNNSIHLGREKSLLLCVVAGIGIVLARLFFWQVLQSSRLQALANDQYERNFTSTGNRGTISTADGYTLVSNQQVYRLFAQPHELTEDPQSIVDKLAPLVIPEMMALQVSTASADFEATTETFSTQLTTKLSNSNSKWVSLASTISEETKNKIKEMKLKGIGFDTYEKRYYPEASMAAHLTGFVGKDDKGEDIGYFGIEGALEQELKARSQKTTIMADAFGFQLPSEEDQKLTVLDGRDITLTIRRDLQNLAENKLAYGMERYGAESGEIIILEPATGDILALAAAPKYDQKTFFQYPANTYGNPSLSSVFEPGSTFKILTVASGIDSGAISPETQCPDCDGPRVFGQYTIRTWNDVYNPNITMTDALAKSDNTAMIYIAEQIGADKLKNYLSNFGIGEALHLELQGDRKTPFPANWRPVELATISFGQGISTTSLQMMRAIGTIANGGVMMRPRIISSVTDRLTGETIKPKAVVERTVISKETAETVTKMMLESAAHGEAQWTASRTHWIAGKTGTAQVAINGKYEEDKTIASFIGFAPADNPKFVMIVKLVAPQSSPWAAETAAPLWYNTAHDLFLLLNIPPDRFEDSEKPKTAAPMVGD